MKGLFAAIAEALKFLNWWAPRRAAHNDKPETKDAKARNEVEREILNDDEAGANRRVADALFRLRMRNSRAAKDNPGRQGDQAR